MAPRSLPEVAEVMLRPFVEGDPIARQIGDDRARRFRFSRAARARRRRGPAVGARAVPRTDGGVQGFRRAIPRGLAAAHPHRECATGRSTSSSRPRETPAARWRRRFIAGPGIVVSVLFPKGLVSPTQERQLTCWGDNVHSYRVERHVRRLPAPREGGVRRRAALKSRFELSSANSINLGRLLPQAVYYAATSLAV